MPRKKIKITSKVGDKIHDEAFIREIRDGVIAGSPDSSKHLTFREGMKRDLDVHITNQETGERETIPIINILKEIIDDRIYYKDIEEFRREYQEAFICYWDEIILSKSNTIEEEERIIVQAENGDIDEWLEISKRAIRTQVKDFDFGMVAEDELLLVLLFDLAQERIEIYHLNKDDGGWLLLEITRIIETLSVFEDLLGIEDD